MNLTLTKDSAANRDPSTTGVGSHWNNGLRERLLLLAVLLLTLAVRLYHLGAPLVGRHTWRQTDTAAMARNFFENGYQLLYPQIDWGGNAAGYVETEFQFYTFLVAILYKLFGFGEHWGRLVSALFSVVTAYFLYLLVRKHVDGKSALWASLFFGLLPLNIYYGRAFMPEATMLMGSVAGMYFFSQWLDSGQWRYWLLSVLSIGLACLVKIPCLYLFLPLLSLAFLKFGWGAVRKPLVWLYFPCVLMLVGAWYYHAHQILHHYGLTFGIWEYSSDKWGNWGLLFSGRFLVRLLVNRLAFWHFATFGFIIFVAGILAKRRTSPERLFDYWLAAVVIYFAIVAKGNFVHEYYQLPIVLPACAFMGKLYGRYLFPALLPGGIRSLKQHAATVTLALLLVGFLATSRWIYLQHYMIYEDPAASHELALGRAVQSATPPGSLLVAVDNLDPSLLYHTHRKGWHATPEDLTPAFLQGKSAAGASYLVGLHKDFSKAQQPPLRSLLRRYPVIANNDRFFIVKLPSGQPQQRLSSRVLKP